VSFVCVVCIVQGLGSAVNPKDQISDGVRVGIGAAPTDRITRRGAHPDHAGFAPLLSDAVGVVDVRCPVAPVRIELAPCCGLDCEGVVHVLCFVVCILGAPPANPAAEGTPCRLPYFLSSCCAARMISAVITRRGRIGSQAT